MHGLRHGIDTQMAAHGDAKKRKILLSPRTIQFHIVRLGDLARAHITDDTDNLRRRAGAANEKCFPNGIIITENFFRSRLANEQHILMTRPVMLIEVASGQDRNAPGLEVIRRNVVGGCSCALVDR